MEWFWLPPFHSKWGLQHSLNTIRLVNRLNAGFDVGDGQQGLDLAAVAIRVWLSNLLLELRICEVNIRDWLARLC